jgi:SAM-dependent methyltransferase
MRIIYRYLLDWVSRVSGDQLSSRILDYGCGSGEVVAAGRRLGFEIWGVDVFYAGSTSRDDVIRRGMLGDTVHEIRDGRIDFEDGYFDFVISNQVFEHVEDLEASLKEISRVMKDDASLLCFFPSKEIIREGHIGIPFVHRFSKGTRHRYAYTLVMRSMGFGHHKGEKSRADWTTDQLEWLDRYTHYRIKKEIDRSFSGYFHLSEFEEDYIRFRMGENRLLRQLVPLLMLPGALRLARFLFHRLAGMIFLARKRRTGPGVDARRGGLFSSGNL